MKMYAPFILLGIVFTAVPAFAESAEEIIPGLTNRDCPNKIVETKTIEGIYTGWHKQKLRAVSIQTQEGKEPVYIAASYDEAKKIFGERTGKPFSVTYKVRQSWWDVDKWCSQIKMLVSAKQIASLKPVPEQKEEIPATEETTSVPDQTQPNSQSESEDVISSSQNELPENAAVPSHSSQKDGKATQ